MAKLVDIIQEQYEKFNEPIDFARWVTKEHPFNDALKYYYAGDRRAQ